MSAFKCLVVVCLLAVSGNGQVPTDVPRTVTTNMNLRMQQSARELFTTVSAQTAEAQRCEYWATGFGERILFTCWGCIKYTPDAVGGNYYINNKTSTILELEIAATGLRYVLFSINKIF